MQMTSEEIYRRYKESKTPRNQIQILAELNACEPAYIKKIIADYMKEKGIEETDQDKILRNRGGRPKAVITHQVMKDENAVEKEETKAVREVLVGEPKHEEEPKKHKSCNKYVKKALSDKIENLKHEIEELEKKKQDLIDMWGALTEYVSGIPDEDGGEQE